LLQPFKEHDFFLQLSIRLINTRQYRGQRPTNRTKEKHSKQHQDDTENMLSQRVPRHITIPHSSHSSHDEVEGADVLVDGGGVADLWVEPPAGPFLGLHADEDPEAGEQVVHVDYGEEEVAETFVAGREFQSIVKLLL